MEIKQKEQMNALELFGGGLGACIYPFFIILLLRDTGEDGEPKVSFTSFSLFCMLDLLMFISALGEDGAWFLPAIFTLGTFAVSTVLLYRRLIRFSWLDPVIFVLVVVCAAIYLTAGSYWSLRASLAAIALAGIPQIKRTWDTPQGRFGYIWLAFFASSAFTLWGVLLEPEGYMLENMGFAGLTAVQCVCTVAFSFLCFASMDIKTRWHKTLEFCSVMLLAAGKVGLAIASVLGWPLSLFGYALAIWYNYLTGKLILALTLVGVVGTCGYGWHKWHHGVEGLGTVDYAVVGIVGVLVIVMYVSMYMREATERSMDMVSDRKPTTIHREALVMIILFAALLFLGWQWTIVGWALMAANHVLVFTVYRQGGDKMLMWLQVVSFIIAVIALVKEVADSVARAAA